MNLIFKENKQYLIIKKMNDNTNNINKSAIMTNAIFFIMPFASFYNIDNNICKAIGSVIIALIFMLSCVNLMKKVDSRMLEFIFYGVLIIAMYTISLVINNSFNGIQTFMQMIIILTCFFSATEMELSKTNINMLKISIFILLCVCFYPSINGIKQTYGGWTSIYGVSNFLGIFSFLFVQICFLLYKQTKHKIFIFFMSIFLLLIILSKTRTALFGVLIYMCMFILINKRNNITIWRFIKYFTFIVIISIIIIYPNLNKFSWYPEAANLVLNMTGKILLSGREIVWKESIKIFINNLFLGYGFDVMQNYNIEPHNSYLTICLQNGILGIIIIFMFINRLTNQIIINRENQLTKFCFCSFMTNLIISSFEVMLFQGQIVLSLLIWILAGIGINKSLIKNFNDLKDIYKFLEKRHCCEIRITKKTIKIMQKW